MNLWRRFAMVRAPRSAELCMSPRVPPSMWRRDMRSWTDIVIGGFHVDYTKTNPWRASGSAPIYSPCGVAGGNPEGCPVGEGEIGDNCPGGGFAYGPDAVNVDFQDVQTTEWRAGGVAEVGWGIVANHGGGYSYRLCPK